MKSYSKRVVVFVVGFSLACFNVSQAQVLQEPSQSEFLSNQIIVKLRQDKTLADVSDLTAKYSVVSTDKVFRDTPNLQAEINALYNELAQLNAESNDSSLDASEVIQSIEAQIATKQNLIERLNRRQQRAPVWAEAAPDLSNIHLIQVPEGTDVQLMVEEFKRDPNVEYAELNYVAHANGFPDDLPNDTYVDPNGDNIWEQGRWGLDYPDMWGLEKIEADQAWPISQGSGVIVAVVDSGIDYNHEDLVGNVIIGWDFIGADYRNPQEDDDPMDVWGHGTHVAGTIAALGNNNQGIIGVAPQANVMAVRGLDNLGAGTFTTLANSIIYATNNGADIINNSWSSVRESFLIKDAVTYAYARGCVLIASAGNENLNTRLVIPASYSQVISVGSTDNIDRKSFFANYNFLIDVTAPGGSLDWKVVPNAQNDDGFYVISKMINQPELKFVYSSVAPPMDHITVYLNKGPNGGIIDYKIWNSFVLVAEGTLDTFNPVSEFHVPYIIDLNGAQVFIRGELKLVEPSADTQEFAFDNIDINGVILDETDYGVNVNYLTLTDNIRSGRDILSSRAQDADMYSDGHSIVDQKYYRLRGESMGFGTSMSTSHVSGVAALILAKNPALGVDDVRHILQFTADDLGDPGRDDFFGYGRINARQAVEVDELNLISHITSPEFRSYVDYNAPILIKGYASGADFLKYNITITNLSEASTPEVFEYTTPVTNDILHAWQPNKIDNLPGIYEIKLSVESNGGIVIEDAVRVILLNSHSGWPAKTTGRYFGIVTYGDIDGDGANEIVAYSGDAVYAWELNGTEVVDGDQNPQTIGVLADTPPSQVGDGGPHGFPPALGNIDGDEALEIIIGTRQGVYAFQSNGELVSGWPKEEDKTFLQQPVRSPVVTADLNNDGIMEVIGVTVDDLFTGIMFVWDAQGNELARYTSDSLFTQIAVGDIDSDGVKEIVAGQLDGKVAAYNLVSGTIWEKTMAEGGSPSGIVLGDVDGDENTLEVIVANLRGIPDQLFIGILNNFGEVIDEWEVFPDVDHQIAPDQIALTDLDGDGDLEFIIRSAVSNFNQYAISAWQHTGELMWVSDNSTPMSYPVIADVDSDGFPDVVSSLEVGSNEHDFKIFAWDQTGAVISGWPKKLHMIDNGIPYYSGLIQTTLGDIDQDGEIDLLTSNGYGEEGAPIFFIDLDETYNERASHWPMYRHDAQHTSCLGCTEGSVSLPVVEFSRPDSTGAEDEDAFIKVVLNQPSLNIVKVNYTTLAGTATAGLDYSPSSGQVQFMPGEVEQLIMIPVIDDSFVEGDETFSAVLSNPINAVLGDITTHEYTIEDND